ncbi:hypothetical protein E4U54_005447 [Claviceps lovelessii]|nr:hypothetical protein E4U54_005447 [Claviceps lovelessii]
MAQLQLRTVQRLRRTCNTSNFAAARVLHGQATTRCYATEIEPQKPEPPRQGNEMKLGRSFQGQVMGSIGARLRREREQREQYERWRNMTDPSRNWMVTFRTLLQHVRERERKEATGNRYG